MRFGLFTGMGNQTWDGVLSLWRHAEATGWDIACVTDHFMPNTPSREGPVLEAWSCLSALAAVIPRMQIGTIVLGNTYRHPAVVAKMAAQVDLISGGRLLMGMGAGWQQNEHDAYGITLPPMRERLDRMDEACQVMRLLWSQERSNFEGRYYNLSDAPLDPKPLQRPYPELMIGGAGEKVTLRIVAELADHWNVWGGPDILSHKSTILGTHCERAGRDPGSIIRSVNMAFFVSDARNEVEAFVDSVAKRMNRTAEDARDICLAGSPAQIVDKLGALQAAGADVLFFPTMFNSPAALPDEMDRFIEEFAPAVREPGTAGR